MSVLQNMEQYKTKYNCSVQNVLLLSEYKSYTVIKKLRMDYTFSELFYKKYVWLD